MGVDTSAILCIHFDEPHAAWVAGHLASAPQLWMSTINLTECLICLRDRNGDGAADLEHDLLTSGIIFVPPDQAQAILAAHARLTYPLNVGDCFAYALAKTQALPLLTLDRDFRPTDIQILIPSKP